MHNGTLVLPMVPWASTGVIFSHWFELPILDLVLFANHIWLLLAHLRDVATMSTSHGAHWSLPGWWPPVEGSSALSTEPLQSPAHSNALPLAHGLG